MNPLTNFSEFKRADCLQGPADLYVILLTVKHGFANGESKLGHYSITKAQAKRAGIDWSFVISAVEILGLRIENRHGRHGHAIFI